MDVGASRKAASGATGRHLLSRLVEAVQAPLSQVADCDVTLGEHPSHVVVPMESPKALPDCSDGGPWDAGLVDRWVARAGTLHHWANDGDHLISWVALGSRRYSTGQTLSK